MELRELYELLNETEKQLRQTDGFSTRYLDLMICRDTLKSSIMHKLEAIVLEYNLFDEKAA